MAGGAFDILRQIAASPRGEVFEALDPANGERVVLKMAPGSQSEGIEASQAGRERLEREAAILAGLDHRGVARFVSLREIDDQYVLVLKHVGGRSLEEILETSKAPVAEQELREFLAGLADAVAYLHGKSIFHRDLKPENVIVDSKGQPVIVDFGNARDPRRGAAGAPAYATTGYSAPEIYGAPGSEGPWTDVYSLAAIAYRIMTGGAPAGAETQSGASGIEPVATLCGQAYSAEFLEIIDSSLSRDPTRRVQSASEFRDLMLSLDGSSKAEGRAPSDKAEGPVPSPYPPTLAVAQRALPPMAAQSQHRQDAASRGRRRRGPLITAAVIILLCAAVAAWQAWPLYLRYVKSTWVVDTTGAGDTTRISDALSRAREGAIIVVRAGTYRESLTITRSVQLTGDPDAAEPAMITPIVGPCLVVSSPQGTVTGLHFRTEETFGSFSSPCLIINGGQARVSENVIHHARGGGIVVAAGASAEIIDNSIEASGGAGLMIRGGAAPRVVGNTIAASKGAGVVIAEGARGILENNAISDSARSGIEVASGAGPHIIGNEVSGSGEVGLYLYGAASGVIEDNRFVDNALGGIIIENGAGPALRGNLLEKSGDHGVVVLSGSALLEGNTVRDSAGHGIAIAKGTSVELSDNELSGNKMPELLENAAPKPR
jgi:parallel beta-helix repeat protein